jgi:hypothetical protein
MAGIVVFSSVSEALRAGFQIYDRTSSGYLVRMRTARGWALALVYVPAAGQPARANGAMHGEPR